MSSSGPEGTPCTLQPRGSVPANGPTLFHHPPSCLGTPAWRTVGESAWTGRIPANEAALCWASERETTPNESGISSMDKGRLGSRCACGRGRGRQLLLAGRGGPPTLVGGARGKEAPPWGNAAAERAHCLPHSRPGLADTARKAHCPSWASSQAGHGRQPPPAPQLWDRQGHEGGAALEVGQRRVQGASRVWRAGSGPEGRWGAALGQSHFGGVLPPLLGSCSSSGQPPACATSFLCTCLPTWPQHRSFPRTDTCCLLCPQRPDFPEKAEGLGGPWSDMARATSAGDQAPHGHSTLDACPGR